MILLKKHGGIAVGAEELVDALAEFGIFFGKEFGARAVVGEVPALARRPRCERRRRRKCRRTCVARCLLSITMECRHRPPAPGCQRGRVGCWVKLATSFQFWPPSSLRKRAAGATPAKRTPGWLAWPASRCQMRSSLTPDCSGNFRGSVVPGFAQIRGAGQFAAEPGIVDGGPDAAVARVVDGVVDFASGMERAAAFPAAAVGAGKKKQAFFCASQEQDFFCQAHRSLELTCQ